MRKISLVLIFIISNAAFSEDDPVTGLKIAPGWELIRMHCGACHSYKLVTSQRADREGWHDMINGCNKHRISGNLIQSSRVRYWIICLVHILRERT